MYPSYIEAWIKSNFGMLFALYVVIQCIYGKEDNEHLQHRPLPRQILSEYRVLIQSPNAEARPGFRVRMTSEIEW